MKYSPLNSDEIDEVLSETSQQRRDAQRSKRARHFIRGPIPMVWIEQAARLPGNALAVSLLLWFRHGMSGTSVRLTHELLERFGIGRKAGYRAISALETAGLIQATRKKGKCPEITIIANPEAIQSPSSLMKRKRRNAR